MKILASLIMFVLLGVSINAQEEAKVMAELAASNEKAIKNSPFSAEAISESVQVLADGNRIVRSTNSKMYRNSEGRFRREISGGTGGYLGSLYTYGQGISILDPIAGQRFTLDSLGKTARVVELRSGGQGGVAGTNQTTIVKAKERLTEAQITELKAKGSGQNLTIEQKVHLEKTLTELKATAPLIALTGQGVHSIAASPVEGGSYAYTIGTGSTAKYETKTEDLGTRDFEGVSAEGTRRVTTIPADAIGNERPIETTYERWYSKELGLVVYSKQSDPRFGDQTYRLTNIVRSEPDPSLFTVPSGYKVMYEPHPVYKLSTTLKNTVVASPAMSAPKPAIATSVKSPKN